VLIRDLADTDLDLATAINQANIPAVGDADEAKLRHIFGQCRVALGAFADEPGASGSLAGFCLVLPPGADYGSLNYRWFTERYDSFAYLDRVAVDEQFRNQGVGAALYAEVEARLAGTAEWFTLEVNLRPRNDGSLRFHHRLGFTEVGQQETDYGVLVSMLAKPLPR